MKIQSIARKIELLKDKYPHLKHFKTKDAIITNDKSMGDYIYYYFHQEFRANPNYEKEKQAVHDGIRQGHRGLTIPAIQIAYYPPEDGISLRVTISSSGAIQVEVRGAETDQIKEIRETVERFAKEENK